MVSNPTPGADPTVTFWGAAQTVTGSMHQVDVGGRSLLLDCGIVQGSRSRSIERNQTFPFRPKDIDAVLLSHAHVDHCGNLPNLVRQGFTGLIYCTPATRALSDVMLGDSAKIQEEEACYLNYKRHKSDPPVSPLFDSRDVFRTLIKMEAVPYDQPISVFPGIEATFVNAGHLLGSAMIHLQSAGRSLTYTGDLGRPELPILSDPAPVPACDLLISESTYGGQTHPPVEETAEHLGEVVRQTMERGGKLIIPAFSVGRTQTIVYFLHQLLHAGRLPDVPIYVDSPMAVRATEVFRAHPECFDENTRQLLREHPDLFGGRRIRYIENVNESIALNEKPEPCVIISASGMCEAGRILYHLTHTIDNPRNTILIAGYQAADTLGRRIAERQSSLRILGRVFTLRAEVVVLKGLSAHADHVSLLRQLSPIAEKVRHVRLVHGEMDRASALAEGLRGVGFADVAIPERGQSIEL